MDLFTSLQGPFAGLGSQGLFLMSSTVILLIIIFFMYKTYRASMNVEARLSEFASLSQSAFGQSVWEETSRWIEEEEFGAALEAFETNSALQPYHGECRRALEILYAKLVTRRCLELRAVD